MKPFPAPSCPRRAPSGAKSLLMLGLIIQACALSAHAQSLGPCTIETIAGGGTVPTGDGGPAVDAEVFSPEAARVAPDGSLYIADTRHQVIRRVDGAGTISTIIGSGAEGFAGDGGPALAAKLSFPTFLAFAPDGTLYFVDSGNNRVRRVSLDGIITTVAGNGDTTFSGDGGPATEAGLGLPRGIAVDTGGNLYIALSSQHRVVRITPEGTLATFAGIGPVNRSSGGFSGDGGLATEAAVNQPRDVAVDHEGRVYIADSRNRRIRRVLVDGTIETLAGNGGSSPSPDGTPRQNASGFSDWVEVDGSGAIYWPERTANSIRRVGEDGLLETAVTYDLGSGFLFKNFSVSLEAGIHLIGRNQVFRFGAEGEQLSVAGIGIRTKLGDGGPALDAKLAGLGGIAVGPDGALYVTESLLNRVRVVTPGGDIEPFAGTGEFGTTEDGGPALEAVFTDLSDVAVDGAGNVYVMDRNSAVIKKVDGSGIVSAFAGRGQSCRTPACGDGGRATGAPIPRPSQIAADSTGNVYVLHEARGRVPEKWIRKIDTEGIITTLLTVLPDGRTIENASAIATGLDDHLVVSVGEFRAEIWKISPAGEFTEVEGANGFVRSANTLAHDDAGNTYMNEWVFSFVRRLTPSSLLGRIAGQGGVTGLVESGFAGDGGPAAESLLSRPNVMALNRNGNLYIGDSSNGRIRRINDVAACEVPSRPQIAIGGLAHGASFGGGTMAPGLIFSVFGVRLGPSQLATLRLDERGRFATELEGTRVLFNSTPAPMIFTSANQVSAIAPYDIEINSRFNDETGEFELEGQLTRVEVEYQGVRSEVTGAEGREAAPGIFTLDSSGSGQAAALNQDGTINRISNPAAPGSIIVFYATGEGQTDPPGVDGLIATEAFPKPLLPVDVQIGGQTADVLYAGAAPGLVAGVLQINARIPVGIAPSAAVRVQLIVGRWQGGIVTAAVGE